MGNINLDSLNKQFKQACSHYMEHFCLVQIFSEATRVTQTSKTLTDHIYTNCTEKIIQQMYLNWIHLPFYKTFHKTCIL